MRVRLGLGRGLSLGLGLGFEVGGSGHRRERREDGRRKGQRFSQFPPRCWVGVELSSFGL